MCEFDRQYNQLMGLINDYLYNLLGENGKISWHNL